MTYKIDVCRFAPTLLLLVHGSSLNKLLVLSVAIWVGEKNRVLSLSESSSLPSIQTILLPLALQLLTVLTPPVLLVTLHSEQYVHYESLP